MSAVFREELPERGSDGQVSLECMREYGNTLLDLGSLTLAEPSVSPFIVRILLGPYGDRDCDPDRILRPYWRLCCTFMSRPPIGLGDCALSGRFVA